MEYRLTRRRHPPTPTPPSPRLIRSRSEAENNSGSSNTCQRLVNNNRSKSTTRSSRTNNANPSTSIKPSSCRQDNRESSRSKDGFVRFLQNSGNSTTSPRINNSVPTNKRPTSSASSLSPSAWALSPGRTSFFNVLPGPAERRQVERDDKLSPVTSGERRQVKKSGGGGMASVLRYFRQKKVSPIQEEEYHNFKVLHNRLLQWRFVNARAEAAMSSVKVASRNKIFHVWLRIFNMRNIMLERRIEIGKLKHEIKSCQIINPQMKLLNVWAKLEGKNIESVGRVTRKLSALSVKLPLAEDVKGDMESIYEALSNAIRVMDGIETTITKFLLEVEKILYMQTELSSHLENQKESLEEIEKIVTYVARLVAWEESARVHLLQLVEDSRREEQGV